MLTCGYYSYWSGLGTTGLEIYHLDPPLLIVSFQTNEGLACLAVQWPLAQFPAIRRDIEGQFLQAVDRVPALAERVRRGQRAERFRGTAALPNFFRKAFGPGWALVGDAGLHKDPITASGISDAFRDAELLADAIDAGLSGRQPLPEALAGYERQREAAALPPYEDACRSAAFAPVPPEVLQVRAALRGHPELVNRLYGVGRGLVPAEEFAPENLQRLLRDAG